MMLGLPNIGFLSEKDLILTGSRDWCVNSRQRLKLRRTDANMHRNGIRGCSSEKTAVCRAINGLAEAGTDPPKPT